MWPKIGLAWQRVTGLFFFAFFLEGNGFGAEMCLYFKLCIQQIKDSLPFHPTLSPEFCLLVASSRTSPAGFRNNTNYCVIQGHRKKEIAYSN